MRITKRIALSVLIVIILIYGILTSISYIGILQTRNSFTSITSNKFITPICETNISVSPMTEKWISKQIYDKNHELFNKETKFDIVYAWVNGSDQRHGKMRQKYHSHDGENRYREFDELRYSLRSIEKYFKRFVNKIWIITSDYEDSDEMQIPSWLNTSWKDSITEEPRVEMVKHSEIFSDVDVLPTFNVLAIESQIMNIPKSIDKTIYFNDDMFLGNDLVANHFWTPFYGFVFRLQYDLTVSPEPGDSNSNSEWRALQHTNMLLSKRFGYRHRPYVVHSSNILSNSILKEISKEWAEEFHITSSHRDRGSDIHIKFMFCHYVLEKHREILLLSFLIFKNDANHNGKWEFSERQEILRSLGSGESFGNDRETLNNYDKIIGVPPGLKYSWSSMDGYPYALESPINLLHKGRPNYFNPNQYPPSKRKCKIDFEYCFGKDFMNQRIQSVDIEKIFNRLAYERLGCGDCIIQHIVTSSGDSGLEGFLPPKSDFPYQSDSRTNNIQGGGCIPSQLDYRLFVISQLEKYSYIIGDIPFDFIILKDFDRTRNELKRLEEIKPSTFCINDDISKSSLINPIKNLLREFMENYYETPSKYEIVI